MERFLRKIFVDNFQRKIIAIISGVCIWFLVHNSITATRTFTHVPIRVVNLAAEKTIRGLMPNGILDRKLALTLTGNKDVIERIEPGDFEVVIDASLKPDEWIVQVAKKNLVSLNPDIDLLHSVTHLSQSEFVLRLSRLLTDKIPIYITHPRGEPPEGYQFLDIWPQRLTQIVSGPEEDVKALQAKGLELTFDLSDISLEELNSLASKQSMQGDEVSFSVPDSWKRVQIPFLHDMKQDINGPEAKNLHIDFLRKDLLALDRAVPIRVFYPLATANTINPLTHPLLPSPGILEKEDLLSITEPLFVDDVSRFFLDVVRDNIEVIIIASQKDPNDALQVSVEFVAPPALEEIYVRELLAVTKEMIGSQQAQREQALRIRFREYMQRFELLSSKNTPFKVKAYLSHNGIVVKGFE
ncbi:MAG: hypothetical protein LLF94_05870 [Chlamydiales bacterium]|nr:hypothetical protein [Chlamydiales bacterium]